MNEYAICDFSFRDKDCLHQGVWKLECTDIAQYACQTHLGSLILQHFRLCASVLHVEGYVPTTDKWGIPKLCPVCGGESEHNWEVHRMEATSTYGLQG